MPRRYDQQHAVACEVAELQVRAVGLPAHHTEADLAPFHLPDHRHAVADRSVDPDVRELPAELRHQGREEMFAGDGTGGQEQFSTDRSLVAGDFTTSLLVEFENPLGIVIERPARLGRQDPAAPPLEEGHAERLFEGVNPLAHGGLGHAKRLRRPGEAAQFGGLREGLQMR